MKILALLFAVIVLAIAAGAWALDAGWLEVPLAELESRYATEDSRFADIDGVRLHYMDQGEGPAVLLLHASFMNLRTWDSLAESLSGHFRVVRPDLLIAGLTGPEPGGNYSFERNGELALALMDRLGIEQFAVVATSSGGIVGFNMAADHPERVTRLVLINSAGMPRTAATNPNRPGRFSAIGNWIRQRYQTPGMVRDALDLNFVEPNEPPEWLVSMNYDLWRREGRREAGAKQIANFRTGDPEAVLARIRVPSMILWGLENATVMHLEADVFQHWLKNAPTLLKKYPGVGHYLYLEIPDEFNRDIAEFLSGQRDAELVLQNRTPYSG